MDPAASGLVVVDKDSGPSSHDVVAQMRRLAGTRKVGHAGTLDPMATGVLVVGIGRATRLLGHIANGDKDYDATIRLGAATDSDDAQGVVVQQKATVEVDDVSIRRAVASMVGEIDQVPSSVSAVKVDGRRAYARVRAGEAVDLAPRRVLVSRFDVDEVRRPAPDVIDVDVSVTCSTGTYVRALARDLGNQLDVGGHLTALRRTRVGPFTLAEARTVDQLAERLDTLTLAQSVAAVFVRLDVGPDDALALRHGRRIAPPPVLSADASDDALYGVFDQAGDVIALVRREADTLRVVVGLV
jgi:tRNA pseudouridine55 synthase